MDMAMVMDTMVMERGKLRLLLLLKLMLNPDIIIMAILMDMVTDMATMDMERGKLMLPPVIIMVMDTPMVDMVDMAMDMDMERGRPMLPLVIIMVMDTPMMDMERGRPPPAILIMDMVDMVMDMVMVMDTMVKQYLFISFSKICCIHRNLLESSQQKHRPLFKKNKNSFFEIKRTKLTEK